MLTACPAPTPTVDSGPAPDSGLGLVDAGPAVDAGAVSRALPLDLVADRADGGQASLQVTADLVDLDPTNRLELTIGAHLVDYRIRLLDWRDEVPVSDDLATRTDAGISYRLVLAAPLKAGRTYTLVVDPAVGADLLDDRGRAFDEVRVGLRVSGEIEAPPGKPSRKTKRPR